MNCRKVNQLLSAYMDGELRGIEHRQVFEHIARCVECSREYESFLQMKRMLGCMRNQQPSLDLQERISYAVTWEEAQAANRTPAMLWTRMWMQTADLFASPQGVGLAVIAVLGLYAIVHHLPTVAGSAATNIVWQQTPNSVMELTAGLAPSEPYRFVRPPAYRYRETGLTEHSNFAPVTLRSFEPAPSEHTGNRLDYLQPR